MLPIAFCDYPPSPIFDRNGGRVFPFWNQESKDRLLKLCEMMSAECVEIDSTDVISLIESIAPPLSANGSVVALKDQDSQAARIYAHLTQRNFRGVAALEEIGDEVKIIVCTFASWNYELIRFISSDLKDGKSVRGLIIAGDGQELLLQAVVRAAALYLDLILFSRRLTLYPDAAFDSIATDTHLFIGELADQHKIRSAIAQPDAWSIISMVTHCDGIDLKLSGNAVLCPLPDKESEYLNSPPPRCLHTGVCYRLDTSREQAHKDRKLFAPKELKSPVLVLDACTVMPATDKRVSFNQSLGARIIREATTAVILCNTDIHIGEPLRNAHLVEQLHRGVPVGEVAAEFNDSLNDQEIKRNMILIGDPDFRFANSAPSNDEQKIERRPIVTSKFFDSLYFADLAFVQTVVRFMSSQNTGFLHTVAEKSLKNLEKLQDRLFFHGRNSHGLEETMKITNRCAALLTSAFSAAKKPTYDYWLHLSTRKNSPDAYPCFYCGTIMNSAAAFFSNLTVRRILHICPKCSAMVDIPDGARIEFRRLSENEFLLEAVYKDLPVHARLFMDAPYKEGRRMWRWRSDWKGKNNHRKIIKTQPPASWIVGVNISWGFQFAMLTAPAVNFNWREQTD